jgi:hypothetical protein
MIPLPPDQCPFGNFSLSLQCQAQHADRFIQDCRIRQVVVSQCSFEKKQEAEQFEISCSQCKDDTDLKSWFTFRYFLTGSLHGVIHKHHLRPLRGELNTAAAAYGTQVYPDEF